MKKIFIYYSLTGNGDKVSNYLKNKGYDIRKVIPKKQLPNNMILRILKGGFLAGINYKDKLIDFDSDISEYDSVVIGSPIWNGRLSTPINSVLDKIDLIGKKVTFVLYSGSGDAPKMNKILAEKKDDAKIIHLKEPGKNVELINDKLKEL